MRDSRTYIRLHDGMPDHPKIDGLSDKGFRLLIEAWCWCSRHLTDGHIPGPTWLKRGTPASRRELLAAGLVEETPTGVVMHDYLEHQRSADEVAELREKRREAGRKGGQQRSKRQAKPKASAKQDAKQNPSIDRDRDKDASNEASSVPDADASGSAAGEPTGVTTAQPIIGRWIEHCGQRPPGRVVGQVSREVGAMLAEGIPAVDVEAGLAEWQRKGLHPSTIASVVHERRGKSANNIRYLPNGDVDPASIPRSADEHDWMRRGGR